MKVIGSVKQGKYEKDIKLILELSGEDLFPLDIVRRVAYEDVRLPLSDNKLEKLLHCVFESHKEARRIIEKQTGVMLELHRAVSAVEAEMAKRKEFNVRIEPWEKDCKVGR